MPSRARPKRFSHLSRITLLRDSYQPLAPRVSVGAPGPLDRSSTITSIATHLPREGDTVDSSRRQKFVIFGKSFRRTFILRRLLPARDGPGGAWRCSRSSASSRGPGGRGLAMSRVEESSRCRDPQAVLSELRPVSVTSTMPSTRRPWPRCAVAELDLDLHSLAWKYRCVTLRSSVATMPPSRSSASWLAFLGTPDPADRGESLLGVDQFGDSSTFEPFSGSSPGR